MRVLVVEADEALGRYLQRGLVREGHEVELARDGASGLKHVLDQEPELLVLDLCLPKMDGVQVLQELGGHLAKTSVFVLTARSGLEERIRCFSLGADQVMSKPFSFVEFSARCTALCRRREQIVDTTLRHAGVELDRINRSVRRDGALVELTGKEFSLLEYLMKAGGRCCTRHELLREVWQMSPDAGTNVVDVYVNYLRKKLGTAGSYGSSLSEAIIETVRGDGYRMGAGLQRKPPRNIDRTAILNDETVLRKLSARTETKTGERYVA